MKKIDGVICAPSSADISNQLSKSFWEWMLSQTWLLGFDGWEECLNPEEPVHPNQIVAAEALMEQLRRVFGLEWHWDGLYPPERFDAKAFQSWYSRFSAWTVPWMEAQDWSCAKAIEVARPSDLLWLQRLAEIRSVEAYCKHKSAFVAVSELLPKLPCRIEICPSDPIVADGAGNVELRCDRSALRNLPAVVRRLKTLYQGAIHTIPWNASWLECPQWPDRLVHEIYGYPKMWDRLTSDDRAAVQAIGHWKNAPIGRHVRLDSKAQDDHICRSLPLRHELEIDPFRQRIYKQLRSFTPDEIPLFPTADEWRILHRRLLSTVYSTAGQLRRSNDVVIAGRGTTVQPVYLRTELSWLHEQGSETWSKASSLALKSAVIAWAHMRFQALHPFFDGNGHLGRLWLARQAVELGHVFDPPRWEATRSDYKQHMYQAFSGRDFEPLLKWFGRIFGTTIEPQMLPFRATPLLLMVNQ